MLIILAAWWTIVVVLLSWTFTKVEPTPLDTGIIICMCVLWPVTAVALVPYVAYQMLVASTTRIRKDLKNRGILREFEQWLDDQKEEGKISPKD